MARFFLSSIFIFFLVAFGTFDVQAQSADVQTSTAEEQNETFRDTLVRMRIKREEEEHKKTVTKAEQIRTYAAELLKNAPPVFLPRETEKRLKEIEKNARNIRSDSGGGDDELLEEPPNNLTDTLKRLDETSERLSKLVGKTSRHVMSVTVSAEATEVIQLVKLLRTYLQ